MSVSSMTPLFDAAIPTLPAFPTKDSSSATTTSAFGGSQTDEVKLSVEALAQMLYEQGLSPDNIAMQLDISVKDLSEYIPALMQISAAAVAAIGTPVPQTPPTRKPATAAAPASSAK